MRSLLKERHYGDISVGDIAERATVNRATFYAHFEDKRHLMNTMLADDLHEALLKRLMPPRPMSQDSLGELATALFEFVARLVSQCPKVGNEFRTELGGALQEALQEFLRTWLNHEPGAMRLFPGAQLETVSTLLSWSLYGGAVNWSQMPRRPSAADAAKELVGLVLR